MPDDATAPTSDTPPADTPPADTPPKRGPGRPRKDAAPKAPRGPGRPNKDAQLIAALRDMLAVIFGAGAAVSARPIALDNGDTIPGVGAPGSVSADFLIVAERAEPLATALVHASKQNPALRRALESALTAGAYGELLTVVAGIGIAIAANHDLLPPTLAPMFAGSPPADGA